ncbi:MAG: ChbG/HpnK family deacetylase [Hyphomicrobiaceae bacterium]
MTEGSPGAIHVLPPARGIVLCADDFAMTNGISRAIIELAEAGRLSATSAMTTSRHWPSHATWLARARNKVAAGLHLNLTLGSPLGPMPTFAPNRQLPGISQLTLRALTGRIAKSEVRAEIERQLKAFELEMGFAPDHVDGHQHVHALPGIRAILLDVMTVRYGRTAGRPLLRDPADSVGENLVRGRGRFKAVTLSSLSMGFGLAARRAGFEVNDGFSGVTDFSADRVAADFAGSCAALGSRHMVMCHPGFVDDELSRIDPVTERRQKEFDFLIRGGFAEPIWRPQRSASGDPIVWASAWAGTS